MYEKVGDVTRNRGSSRAAATPGKEASLTKEVSKTQKAQGEKDTRLRRNDLLHGEAKLPLKRQQPRHRGRRPPVRASCGSSSSIYLSISPSIYGRSGWVASWGEKKNTA